MKIVTLSPQQFDKFTKNHPYKNLYQTVQYGNLMTKFGYNIHYLGIVSDTNKLIGATLLLYKQAFMNNKIAYAPRGILYNYENTKNLQDLVKKLKQVLGKQGFMLLRIDPYIPLTVRDSVGNIMNSNIQGNNIIENLKQVGFTYKGKNKYFENEKPRWEGFVLLDNDINSTFSKLEKRTRNKLRKAINFGVEAYKDSEKNIDKLYEFTKDESKKPKSYYQQIISNFKENAEVYYVKINTNTYTINSRKAYESELDNNNYLASMIQNPDASLKQKNNNLNKKMESDKLLDSYKTALIHATNLLKEYPNGVTIGAALVIKYDNAAYILEEGINEKYRGQNAEYVLKWKMIEDYTNQNLKYLNLNKIAGEFSENNKYSLLNEKKLGFNTTITEYIGEFEIVLNNFSYSLYKSFVKNKK